ncbi:Hypothetical_protein [Hexamita inflata]|uniref:Hypothetical_protein n=1 Tax=Hexamita inflata TaxID=28002 RepID=A0AA86QQG7_9EUKA|nr:Hypothetical protein HINF_LOCUS47471 [Hexamita inflata]
MSHSLADSWRWLTGKCCLSPCLVSVISDKYTVGSGGKSVLGSSRLETITRVRSPGVISSRQIQLVKLEALCKRKIDKRPVFLYFQCTVFNSVYVFFVLHVLYFLVTFLLTVDSFLLWSGYSLLLFYLLLYYYYYN